MVRFVNDMVLGLFYVGVMPRGISSSHWSFYALLTVR